MNVFVHEWFNKWKINLNLRPWGFQYNEIWSASLRVIGESKAKHRKGYEESYNFFKIRFWAQKQKNKWKMTKAVTMTSLLIFEYLIRGQKIIPLLFYRTVLDTGKRDSSSMSQDASHQKSHNVWNVPLVFFKYLDHYWIGLLLNDIFWKESRKLRRGQLLLRTLLNSKCPSLITSI